MSNFSKTITDLNKIYHEDINPQEEITPAMHSTINKLQEGFHMGGTHVKWDIEKCFNKGFKKNIISGVYKLGNTIYQVNINPNGTLHAVGSNMKNVSVDDYFDYIKSKLAPSTGGKAFHSGETGALPQPNY